MEESMTIRPFIDSDLPPAAKLFCRVFRLPSWNEEWTYEEALASLKKITLASGYAGFTAVSGNTIIGAVLGRTIDTDSDKSFRIGELFVDPDYQRQGIGTQLFYHLEQELCRLGFQRITCTTEVETAAGFYRKQGFHNIGAASYNPGKHIFEKIIS